MISPRAGRVTFASTGFGASAARESVTLKLKAARPKPRRRTGVAPVSNFSFPYFEEYLVSTADGGKQETRRFKMETGATPVPRSSRSPAFALFWLRSE